MYLSITFTLFLASFLSLADVSDKEMQNFLEAIKENRDEELLIASEQFKKCSEQFEKFKTDTVTKVRVNGKQQKYKDLLIDCVNKEILGDPEAKETDKKLLEIAKNLGLNSFNKKAATSSKSVREYLQKRIRKSIYGQEDRDNVIQKLKTKQYTDHSVFYQLYAEQVGKNTLLEVSKYCLENFGTRNRKTLFTRVDFVHNGDVVKDEKGNSAKALSFASVIEEKQLSSDQNKDEIEFEDLYQLAKDLVDSPQDFFKQKVSKVTQNDREFWRSHERIVEYEVCTRKNEKECKKSFTIQDGNKEIVKPFRSVHELSLLKEAEFALSSKDLDNKIIKDRYSFCAGQVVKKMCELYKCQNVYNEGTPKHVKDRCKEIFNIVVDRSLKTFTHVDDKKRITDFTTLSEGKFEKGAIACNLSKRLEEYRIVLTGVKEIQGNMQANKLDNGEDIRITRLGEGAIQAGFKGEFDRNKIDDLTSISSTELVENVESLKESKELAKTLQENCMNELGDGRFELKAEAKSDDQCSLLLAKLDAAKFGTIELDTKAKTTAKLKELEDLTDVEEIKTFLKSNGLGNYAKRLDEMADDPEKIAEVKSLVSQDFQAKRMALLDRLKEKYRQESGLQVSEEKADEIADVNLRIENEIANQSVADIATHKKRVENLFQYSNIVSSFLEVQDKDGKTLGQNTTGRLKEISDSTKSDEGEGIAKYFVQSNRDSESSSGNISYLEAINEFIDFRAPDEVNSSD